MNITVSTSRDVEGGLFRPGQAFRITPCVTRPKWRGFDNDMLVWFNSKATGGRSPVSKRAWCLLERLLASRMIHFPEDQLFGIATKTEMMNAAWSKLVGAYTQAKLTLKKDKLVAISGLARKADKLHNTLRVCGRQTFLLGSFGESSIPHQHRLQGLTCFAAPLWSWSSVGGVIDLPMTNLYRSTAIRTSIVEAATTPIDDPFGAVSGGHIRIHGPLWEVNVSTETCITGRL